METGLAFFEARDEKFKLRTLEKIAQAGIVIVSEPPKLTQPGTYRRGDGQTDLLAISDRLKFQFLFFKMDKSFLSG
jgi:hypothetical protein